MIALFFAVLAMILLFCTMTAGLTGALFSLGLYFMAASIGSAGISALCLALKR